MGAAEPDPKRLFAAVGRVADGVRTRKNPLEDGGIVALFASPEQREAMDRVGGLMSLLEGHGDGAVVGELLGVVELGEFFQDHGECAGVAGAAEGFGGGTGRPAG